MTPEFALVETLETVPVLQGRVSALQPPRTAAAPFAFYIPTADEEAQDLDGPCGLQSWAGTVHLVSNGARALQLLCAKAKQALHDMRGEVYATPEEDQEEGQKGRVLIEGVEIEQSSPDLYESEVGLYRRVYTVRLEFQTEEEGEALSGAEGEDGGPIWGSAPTEDATDPDTVDGVPTVGTESGPPRASAPTEDATDAGGEDGEVMKEDRA